MMNEIQVKIIKALQNGLPLSPEPFREIAEEIGIPQSELLAQLKAWKDEGIIRRFGAILRHQKAGYTVNAMAVWNVPNNIEGFAEIATKLKSVSHCYQRPRFSDFKYNMYTMIHGRSRQDCEDAATEISTSTGITDYRLLYTTAEYKKSSPVYFTE